MHRVGASSWQIRAGIDQGLAMALYVRDAAGLGRYVLGEPDLPAVHPPVRPREVAVDLGSAIRQWEQWWARALARSDREEEPPHPLDFAGLEDLPVVRLLLQEHFEEIREWMGSVRSVQAQRAEAGSLHLSGFVNAYQDRLGRAVRPFTLVVREVAVQGSNGWVLSPQVVVVSTSLAGDEQALKAFLRPVIDALA